MRYLKSATVELEENNMLHAQIFLDEVHATGTVYIFPGEGVIAVQTIKNVPLEMFQEIDLALELFRVVLDPEVFYGLHGSALLRNDIVDVTRGGISNFRRRCIFLTYSLSGESTIDVLSLKWTPTEPSVRA